MAWNSSETLLTAAVAVIAAGVLVWGWLRSRPYGRLGLLSWLQSLVLMLPWLLFFGLFVAGVYINLIGILMLLVLSSGAYIYLGRRLRAAGQEELLRDRAAQRLQKQQERATAPTNDGSTPETAGTPPIPAEDLKAIQGVFGIDTFFATETIPYQEGAIFKGNLRGEPGPSRERLAAKLETALGEKYRLFLVESPDGRPVVIVLPSSDDPKPAGPALKFLALGLVVGAIATIFEAFGLLIGFDFFQTPNQFREALPLAVGFWAILGAHEIGHWLLARRHRLRLGWPFFIPSLQLGCFGAITRIESLIPSRNALFDVAIAGPAAGGLLSLLMLVAGLSLSQTDSAFQVPSTFFQSSVLVGTLAKVVLGDQLQSSLVDVHPLAIIGWLGLTVTALNVLPAGQLDGGRIVQAIYGRKLARRATIATLGILGAIALFNPINPVPLYWAILVLFLQRNQERPSLDELTEPDDARAALGLLVLFLTLATLIPLSPSLAGSLGIGS